MAVGDVVAINTSMPVISPVTLIAFCAADAGIASVGEIDHMIVSVVGGIAKNVARASSAPVDTRSFVNTSVDVTDSVSVIVPDTVFPLVMIVLVIGYIISGLS